MPPTPARPPANRALRTRPHSSRPLALSLDPAAITAAARGWGELDRLRGTLDEDGVARLQVWSDEDEWRDYSGLGDRVLHIDLAKRNHVLVVAPLSANTLASFALGACPNLLTSLARAWYYDMEASFDAPRTAKYGEHVLRKPFIVAPSMNTYMLEQNVTHAHLGSLRARSVEVIEPAVKVRSFPLQRGFLRLRVWPAQHSGAKASSF